MSTTTPPGRGMVPPLKFVPAPRTVTGRPWSLHRLTTWPRSFRGFGPDHQGRQHRFQHRGVIGVGEPVGFLEKDLVLSQEPLEFFYQAVTDHIRLLLGFGASLYFYKYYALPGLVSIGNTI